MTLRPYQETAIKSLWAFWRATPSGAPLIVAPTGSGKTKIISAICAQILKAKPKYKIIIVSHRKEIISQNAKELYELLSIPIGIYSAGLGSKTIRNITCANIQSIWRKEIEANVVVIDEAHLISRKTDSMYNKFLSNLQGAKIFGLTATPFRLDQGSLIGEGSLFTDVCYDISLTELIADGFLTPLISKRSEQRIDFSKVHKSGYDYNQQELENVMFPLAEKHAEEIKARTFDRKHVLIFCSGVKHAQEMSKVLGTDADYITGEMVAFERDRKLRDFVEGRTRFLCNCEVLTTGFNFPGIDCIVLLRATQSAALYIQAVGRGSRIAEGKTNCLVLDFGANIDRHGPIDCIQVKQNRGKKAKVSKVPFKTCEECGAVVAIRTMVCPSCETAFPAASCKIEKEPSENPVLSEAENFQVENYHIKIHRKEGKPPMLRVIYKNKIQEISEFLCFEHGGYATHFAQKKWKFLGGQPPVPVTTDEAFARSRELIEPEALQVIQAGKFFRVTKILGFKKQQTIEEELAEFGGYNI